MAGNLANILAGVAGGGDSGNALSLFAPPGTTLPVSAAATPDAAFLDPGWVSADDGLTAPISVNSSDVNGFGASGPLRTIKSQQKRQFSIVWVETNPVVLAIYQELPLDAIVPDVAGAFDYVEGPIRNEHYAAIFDVVDGVNLWRAVCPDLQVTDKQSLTIKAASAILYGVTFTAYPGSDGTAVHYMHKMPGLAT